MLTNHGGMGTWEEGWGGGGEKETQSSGKLQPVFKFSHPALTHIGHISDHTSRILSLTPKAYCLGLRQARTLPLNTVGEAEGNVGLPKLRTMVTSCIMVSFPGRLGIPISLATGTLIGGPPVRVWVPGCLRPSRLPTGHDCPELGTNSI